MCIVRGFEGGMLCLLLEPARTVPGTYIRECTAVAAEGALNRLGTFRPPSLGNPGFSSLLSGAF